MMLAKALGGGLVPIGAVLCTEEAYTSAFARKHSSTFAGNALACRAGLATLERLTRDDGRLLQQVARNGRRLKRRLEALAARHSHLIAEVRGRGYMLGLQFAVDRDLWPESLLGTAAEQGFFTPIFASYLLNVEGVRVAPTLNGNSVIRIEPPLTFRWRHCEQLLGALERALEAFSRGETGRILKAILEGEPQPPATSMEGPRPLRAVVCDLSRPANVGAEVAATRPDVLVIDGGVIDLPGRQDIGRFGLGRGQAYACMAETMMLALGGHLRNTSLGTDLAPEVLRMLRALADRHGFRVAQLRSFGRPLDHDTWDRLLVAREQALAAWGRKTA
jgi:hypothetical protein